MCGEMSLDHHLDLLIPNLIFNFTVWDLFTERNKNMKIVVILSQHWESFYPRVKQDTAFAQPSISQELPLSEATVNSP